MKTLTRRPIYLLSAALGVAAFSAAGCAPKNDANVGVTQPSAGYSTQAAMATDRPASQSATAVGAETANVSWGDMETLNFEGRAKFMAGLQQMEAKVDRQLAELAAKRASMTGTVATKDWDFAMKEMNDARTYLKSMREEAANATAQTWDQQKAKVGQAWVRTQDAFEKVKFTTTS